MALYGRAVPSRPRFRGGLLGTDALSRHEQFRSDAVSLKLEVPGRAASADLIPAPQWKACAEAQAVAAVLDAAASVV